MIGERYEKNKTKRSGVSFFNSIDFSIWDFYVLSHGTDDIFKLF
ncbi:hypothetical protein Lac2_10670 [Claveliimonas bilis]|uniref:Uncharacterized protein n=1 Tax=Claveliimonas bilis TaxID=3028070 RepID=A0ABN6YYL8_9FIRM|nr:hypothetical protein Lac1_21410 [Claveliimonas bilis]BDZ81123.1 hypothetical protein Lac3_23320 [Claveliimonas bilis]BDZ82933.1 hypothetical protein Lac2_10670 [Claveliimonas bilis]